MLVPPCMPVCGLCCLDNNSNCSSRREVSGRESDSISLASPCLWGGAPGLVGLVMQWELRELDFSALPATSKKNCRTHEVRHATKTGELQLTGVNWFELTAAALAGSTGLII